MFSSVVRDRQRVSSCALVGSQLSCRQLCCRTIVKQSETIIEKLRLIPFRQWLLSDSAICHRLELGRYTHSGATTT
ncbi:hypothetical protein KTR9_5117 (plasmid) [Gordonia sp. KTR9]|nr:hypothetical protein KTR9_5117 [Gordonia sp. KTR9]